MAMELGCMSIGIASFVSSPRRRPLPIILLAPRFPGIMTGKNTHGRRMEEDGRKEWDAEKRGDRVFAVAGDDGIMFSFFLGEWAQRK